MPERGAGTSGYGHGKLILLGEHAVVHGPSAIAMSVDRGTTATIRWLPVNWKPDDPKLIRAYAALIEPHWHVTLATELPIGRGMGSSAALSVAVVRARYQDLSAEGVIERAMAAERIFHGTPSGIDVVMAASGGVRRFFRGPPRWDEVLPTPDWSVVVLDTRKSRDTAAMVARVAAHRPQFRDPLIRRIGALVEQAVPVLKDARALGELFTANQTALKALGVSTPEIDALVAFAKANGAYGAKLSGAGGGGVVIALSPDPEGLVAKATAKGIPAFVTRPASRETPPSP